MMPRIEKALGLPSLAGAKDALNEINALLQNLNEKRLDTVRHVIDTMLKLQKEGGVEGLKTLSAVVQVIAGIDDKKLDKIVAVTGDVKETANTVHRLIKCLPAGALEKLPFNDIADAVKKAMAEGK